MPVIFQHNAIPTALDTLNILGAGGIREGTVSEIYGPTGSGKSSLVYDLGASFQRKYPDGEVIIIDPETSVDYIRLKYTWNYDLGRVHPRPAESLEAGFGIILDVCNGRFDFEAGRTSRKSGRKSRSETKKLGIRAWDKFCKDVGFESMYVATKIPADFEADLDGMVEKGIIIDDKRAKVPPTLIIWDSIAASKPKLEVDAAMSGDPAMNAGGMGLRARVMEQQLAICNSNIFGLPVTIILLNQVRTTGFGSWAGPTDHYSSGGNALQHFVHYKIYIEKKKKVWDPVLQANRGTISQVAIEKSKFCPTTANILIFIDDTIGGRIRQIDEVQLLAIQLELIKKSGGWVYWSDDPEQKKYRYEALRDNEEARQHCINLITHHYRLSYLTIDMLYQEAGIETGKPTEEERKFFHSNRPVSLDDTNVEINESGDILV